MSDSIAQAVLQIVGDYLGLGLIVPTSEGPLRLLLVDESGQRANELALSQIARDVVVEGQRYRRGELEYMLIAPRSIHPRLGCATV